MSAETLAAERRLREAEDRKRRLAMGAGLDWTDAQLDNLSEITDPDISSATAHVRRYGTAFLLSLILARDLDDTSVSGGIRWDPGAHRYRFPNGSFISDAQIRAELDDYILLSERRLAALTRSLQSGQIDLAEWQDQFIRELKALHVNAATLANGGRAQMRPADWGGVGRLLRDQYEFARNWARDIASGIAPLDDRMLARARLYAQASRGTFETARGRDQERAGANQERWVLHPADHCPGCPEQAGRGWVRIGTLPRIGSQPCRSNCRCTKEFRTAA